MLTGAVPAVRVAIDRDLDLWTGSGRSPGAANAAASALAADLSGQPWRSFYGPVVVCGLELGEAGEEHSVDLTGDRLAALRRRIGRHSAE
ncbi:hypothetical protein FDA94_30340 [Herbidospora galbida]|uniref:Uncharacterized protein n=1 Tax=Herbidospora galbida TaxID=2575442 RepID=A0A4U3M5R4_9ACTN|nr:hypothetical protein [Herbidospora galbida]TKK84225.1 hypothetical protein FDA94_30340 [Herbidospora galbida]